MKSYLTLLQHILDHGKDRSDRTGTGTRGVFGYQWRHDLAEGFPLLTTKKVFFKGVAVELLWILSGSTNVKPLQAQGVHIWDQWCDEKGELGPVYGKQWRNFEGRWGNVDQIATLVSSLLSSPNSRRHIVSAWNPCDISEMALPPCHMLFQCYVADGRLSLHLYARSIDSFLGLPFNIASYALLTHMLAVVTNLQPGELIISFGDLHIYANHMEQVKEQLSREPCPLPHVDITPRASIFGFSLSDFMLMDYQPHPAIKAEVSV